MDRQTDGDPTFPLLVLLLEPKMRNYLDIYFKSYSNIYQNISNGTNIKVHKGYMGG